MRQIYLVARRELLENVRTKAFWLGILGLPVIIIATAVVPILFAKAQDARPYAVIDESGWLLQRVEDRARQEDAKRLLEKARSSAKKGDAEVAALPEPIRGLAAEVKDATDERIGALAVLLAGVPSAAAGETTILDDSSGRVAAARDSFRKWYDGLEPSVARSVEGRLAKSRFRRVETPAGDAESALRAQLDENDKKLFAYLVIGKDPLTGSEGSKYVSNNRTDDDLLDWFSRLATDAVRAERFAREGVSSESAARIQEPLFFEEKQVSAEGDEKEVETKDRVRQFAPPVFTYVLWFSVFISAQMLLTNTIEEKSNKLVEVLLSSLSPVELMVGKTLGIAATGIIVVGSWIGCFVGFLTIVPKLVGGGGGGPKLASIAHDPVFALSFVSYYVLGYLLYAAVLVAIGSVCNSLKEAQNLMMPVTIVLIIPIAALIPVTKDPNGTIAKVLSFIPPFTPFIMMNRAAGPPAAWEYVATTILLVASILLAFYLAAKVFRIGILMTGKPPLPSEILRWLRAPVGTTPERRQPS